MAHEHPPARVLIHVRYRCVCSDKKTNAARQSLGRVGHRMTHQYADAFTCLGTDGRHALLMGVDRHYPRYSLYLQGLLHSHDSIPFLGKDDLELTSQAIDSSSI